MSQSSNMCEEEVRVDRWFSDALHIYGCTISTTGKQRLLLVFIFLIHLLYVSLAGCRQFRVASYPSLNVFGLREEVIAPRGKLYSQRERTYKLRAGFEPGSFWLLGEDANLYHHASVFL